MQHKPNARLFIVLCVLAIIFLIPAVASAGPSIDVTGTVTAAAGGATLEHIRVAAYFWDENHQEWDFDFDTHTAADGTYALNGLGLDTYVIRAWDDDKGIYGQKLSDKLVLTGDAQKQVNFALEKDAAAPTVTGSWWPENHDYFSAIPADVLDWTWAYRVPMLGRIWARDVVEMVDPYGARDFWFARGSGVTTISASINGGPWASMANTEAAVPEQLYYNLRVATEGLNAVSYYAMDKNGNKSVVHSDLLVVDKTAPATNYSNDGKMLMLMADDALSGTAATYYRVGGIGDFVWGTSIAVPTSGTKSLEFYSVDKVGNTEAVKSLTIYAPAKLSTPKASKSSVSHTKSFSVSGSVYGRSKAKGYVRIYKLSGGKYKYSTRKAFTEGSNGKFKVTLKLKAGTYKFESSYGTNTATSSDMPVMSKYSAKVKVN